MSRENSCRRVKNVSHSRIWKKLSTADWKKSIEARGGGLEGGHLEQKEDNVAWSDCAWPTNSKKEF